MRALRGPGPLRLRREKRARKRSDMGWVGSSNRSQRNFSMVLGKDNLDTETLDLFSDT